MITIYHYKIIKILDDLCGRITRETPTFKIKGTEEEWIFAVKRIGKLIFIPFLDEYVVLSKKDYKASYEKSHKLKTVILNDKYFWSKI